MAGKGGKREGAGRKPDAEAQKLRADLKSRLPKAMSAIDKILADPDHQQHVMIACLLYTSPSPRDRTRSRMPSSA